MKWKETLFALGGPLRACFDLTLRERRFLLGVLLLFCLGIAGRWYHQRGDRPEPYVLPQEQPTP